MGYIRYFVSSSHFRTTQILFGLVFNRPVFSTISCPLPSCNILSTSLTHTSLISYLAILQIKMCSRSPVLFLQILHLLSLNPFFPHIPTDPHLMIRAHCSLAIPLKFLSSQCMFTWLCYSSTFYNFRKMWIYLFLPSHSEFLDQLLLSTFYSGSLPFSHYPSLPIVGFIIQYLLYVFSPDTRSGVLSLISALIIMDLI